MILSTGRPQKICQLFFDTSLLCSFPKESKIITPIDFFSKGDEGPGEGYPGGVLHVPGPHHLLHRGPLCQVRLRRRPTETAGLRVRPRQRLLPRGVP